MFRLINLNTGEYLANARSALSFEDGKKAARAAKIASAVLQAKVQPRKVAVGGDENWRERELGRLNSGEYAPLVPTLNYWSLRLFPEHYAHNAKKKPELIAYTRDDEKGRADKQSLVSIETYVKMLAAKAEAGGDDPWHVSTVESLTRKQLDYARTFEKTYQLATTPDDIARVYMEYDRNVDGVSSSCMRYGLDHWPDVDGSGYHPASVYGAGDLAVAYITNDDNKTVARCLVWPAKKIYSRLYAGNDALHRLLKNDGYSKSYYYDHSAPSLRGAKLLRIENDRGNLMCPYLDEVQTVHDNGTNLIIGGELSATSQHGEIAMDEYVDEDVTICDHCDEHCEDGETFTVYISRRSSQEWCCSCNDNETFYCEGNQRTYSCDHVEHYTLDDGTYSEFYVEDYGVRCDKTDELVLETNTVIVDEDGTEEAWCQGACNDHAYLHNDVWYSNDVEHVEVVVERYVPAYKSRMFGYVATHGRTFWLGDTYRGSIWLGTRSVNAWFFDRTQFVPVHLIGQGIDGEDIVTGADGVRYLRGYHDNYPMERERLDVDLISLMETELAEAA